MITEDGYILTLFRCTNETAPSNGRAVILMHGILAASDDYVMNIPNQGLGKKIKMVKLLVDFRVCSGEMHPSECSICLD